MSDVNVKEGVVEFLGTLTIRFEYDHAAGMFKANLPNGASFWVDRSHIGGKLENALTLFKRQVIDLESGKYVKTKQADGSFTYTYDETQVRRFKRNGDPDIELPDLELDLSDLEL